MENETDVLCENPVSDAQKEIITTLAWWFDTFAYLVLGLLGFMLNVFAMRILLNPTMWNNFFNRLLMCLSFYDGAFILCGLLEIFRKWLELPIQQYMFAKFFYPIRSIAMCSSIYATLALTLERYQAITSPIKYRNRTANISLGKRLLFYILPVMIFSFLYYSPKFFDLYVEEVSDCAATKNQSSKNITGNDEQSEVECSTKHEIHPTALRMDHQYIFWYLNVSNLIVTCVIPISVLLFMNCRIATSLNEYRKRRPATSVKTKNDTATLRNNERQQTSQKTNMNVKQTFILFSIVILFVICHALRIALNVTEFMNLEWLTLERQKGCDGISFWQEITIPISEFLLLFNSSAHFFVYLVFDKAFQQIINDRFLVLKRIFIPSQTSQSQQSETIPLNVQRVMTTEQTTNNETA